MDRIQNFLKELTLGDVSLEELYQSSQEYINSSEKRHAKEIKGLKAELFRLKAETERLATRDVKYTRQSHELAEAFQQLALNMPMRVEALRYIDKIPSESLKVSACRQLFMKWATEALSIGPDNKDWTLKEDLIHLSQRFPEGAQRIAEFAKELMRQHPGPAAFAYTQKSLLDAIHNNEDRQSVYLSWLESCMGGPLEKNYFPLFEAWANGAQLEEAQFVLVKLYIKFVFESGGTLSTQECQAYYTTALDIAERTGIYTPSAYAYLSISLFFQKNYQEKDVFLFQLIGYNWASAHAMAQALIEMLLDEAPEQSQAQQLAYFSYGWLSHIASQQGDYKLATQYAKLRSKHLLSHDNFRPFLESGLKLYDAHATRCWPSPQAQLQTWQKALRGLGTHTSPGRALRLKRELYSYARTFTVDLHRLFGNDQSLFPKLKEA